MDLTVLYGLSYGLYAVGVMDDGVPTGCIVNTACQITSENPIISICMSKKNHTNDVLKKSKSFSISILHEEVEPIVIGMLGFQSGRSVKKFDTVPYEMFGGLPILVQSCGAMTLDIVKSVDMETHEVYYGRLIDTKAGTHANPMTYAYYHRVRRGKAPKNAPTYRGDAVEAPSNEVYVCSVCGYEYHGDITKEPDTYVCPQCGFPKSAFVKKS